MKEGSLKMLARNSDYELMLNQSSDKGKTWEEGKKVAGLFGVEGESIYKAALWIPRNLPCPSLCQYCRSPSGFPHPQCIDLLL